MCGVFYFYQTNLLISFFLISAIHLLKSMLFLKSGISSSDVLSRGFLMGRRFKQ